MFMFSYLVDGGFTKWSDFGKCSKSCGGGSQESTRSCTKPKPLYGGDACEGPVSRTRACNTHACPGKCISIIIPRTSMMEFFTKMINDFYP